MLMHAIGDARASHVELNADTPRCNCAERNPLVRVAATICIKLRSMTEIRRCEPAEVNPMKAMLKQPCNECPWRRQHPAGWLGGYKPEDFTQQIQFDGPPLPCHKTIPGDGTDARAMCAGALIFMKNSCKRAQHPDYGDALDTVEEDTETVFQWSQEFLEHHKNPELWIESIRAKLRNRT